MVLPGLIEKLLSSDSMLLESRRLCLVLRASGGQRRSARLAKLFGSARSARQPRRRDQRSAEDVAVTARQANGQGLTANGSSSGTSFLRTHPFAGYRARGGAPARDLRLPGFANVAQPQADSRARDQRGTGPSLMSVNPRRSAAPRRRPPAGWARCPPASSSSCPSSASRGASSCG